MKLKILISILFIIVTTFSAVHEMEHTVNGDDSSCLVCHVSDNIASADIIDEVEDIEVFHFEKIAHKNLVSKLHLKEKNNQNRAPPVQS